MGLKAVLSESEAPVKVTEIVSSGQVVLRHRKYFSVFIWIEGASAPHLNN